MMRHFQQPTPPPGQEKCDFCSAQPVKWRYPARAHVMGTVKLPGIHFEGRSPDDWAACQACHILIAQGERERLAVRSARRFARLHGGKVTQHVKHIRQVHDNFWAAREGAPEPIEVT